MSTTYITIENPTFKTGLVLKNYSSQKEWHFDGAFSLITFKESDIEFMLDNDIIEEIQEPEFTKSDMKNFTMYFSEYYPNSLNDDDFKEAFEFWTSEKR